MTLWWLTALPTLVIAWPWLAGFGTSTPGGISLETGAFSGGSSTPGGPSFGDDEREGFSYK